MNSLVRLCRLGGCEVAAAGGGLAVLWRRGHDWQRPWDGGQHKALVPLTADRCGPRSHSGATLDLKPLVAQLLGLFLFYFYFLMILVCSEKQRYGFYVTGPIGSMWPNVIQIFPEYPAKPICGRCGQQAAAFQPAVQPLRFHGTVAISCLPGLEIAVTQVLSCKAT